MTKFLSKGWAAKGARKCSVCGQPYQRRNLTEVWDTRNPGHRLGWNKTIIKLCMRCFSIEQALRVTAVIAIEPGPTKQAERRLELLRKQIAEINNRRKEPIALPLPKEPEPTLEDIKVKIPGKD